VDAVADYRVVRVSGHKQDLHIRADVGQPCPKFAAAHARHDHIGQQHIDRSFEIAAKSDRFVPVGRFEHGVPFALQDLEHKRAHHIVVFDKQDRLGSAIAVVRFNTAAVFFRNFIDHRQINIEPGAFPVSLVIQI